MSFILYTYVWILVVIYRSGGEDIPELDNVDDLEEDEEPLVTDQEQW